eukprot:m.158295 g.158295  ORF g.158295 m.158295 type:complete len:505 (-) comp15133_c0_seq4:288-1802(-)
MLDRVLGLLLLMFEFRYVSTQVKGCDVLINGGSVAGFAAALVSASENVSTCLLEPTDWLGGQLTANGIPAVDFSPEGYPKKFGDTLDTQQANLPPTFYKLLQQLGDPNFITCWVSPYCFLPDRFVHEGLQPLVQHYASYLQVFYNTVPIAASTTSLKESEGNTSTVEITSITAVQRTPMEGTPCLRLSEEWADRYSRKNSSISSKNILEFKNTKVFVETSYIGDFLVLADAYFLQGCDERYDGDIAGTHGNDTLGQSMTMTYQILMHASNVTEPNYSYPVNPNWTFGAFEPSPAIHTPTHTLSWDELWTRRRSYYAGPIPPNVTNDTNGSFGMNPPPYNYISPGDVSLMAWGDYYYSYIFRSKHDARLSRDQGAWQGGVNIETLDGAERYSYAGYKYFKSKAPQPKHLTLNSTHLGTCTGLCKMPYIRDGRRSVGVDGFLLNLSMYARPTPVSTIFPDRLGLVMHGVDIWGHRMKPYENLYPTYMQDSGTYLVLFRFVHSRMQM